MWSWISPKHSFINSWAFQGFMLSHESVSGRACRHYSLLVLLTLIMNTDLAKYVWKRTFWCSLFISFNNFILLIFSKFETILFKILNIFGFREIFLLMRNCMTISVSILFVFRWRVNLLVIWKFWKLFKMSFSNVLVMPKVIGILL